MFKKFATVYGKRVFSKVPVFTPILFSYIPFTTLDEKNLKKELYTTLSLSNFKKIKELATKGLEKSPNDIYLLVYLLLANTYLDEKDENIEKKIENFIPTNSEEKYAKGLYLISKGDHNNGYNMIKESADENYPEAVLEIGRFYLPKDKEKAKEYFKKAFNLGIDMAKVDFAVSLLSGTDALKGVRLLEELKELKLSDYFLFLAYNDGIGVKKDKNKALEYLKSSVEQGNSVAETQLAAILLQKKDFQEALYWAERAAEKGNPNGKLLLGNMLIEGIGRTDIQKGLELLMKLVDQRNSNGMKSLARHFIKRFKIYDQAQLLYHLCAEMGDDDCKFYLGMCYIHGIGVDQDIEKGKEIIRNSFIGKNLEPHMDNISNIIPQDWEDEQVEEEQNNN